MNIRDFNQLWLVAVFKLFDFDVETQADQVGVCLGIAKMGEQAVLSGDVDTLDARLERMMSLAERMQKEHERAIAANQGKNLSEEEMKVIFEDIKKKMLSEISDKKRIDIMAFLGSCYVHQYPRANRDVLGRGKLFVPQLNKLVTPLVMSETLKEKGGVYEAANIAAVMTEGELVDYFKKLGEVFQKNAKEPVSIGFICNKHAITIGYDPKEKEWQVIDANQLPTETIEISDYEEMAEAFCECFALKEGDSAIFRAQFSSVQTNKDMLDGIIEELNKSKTWNKLHRVTTEKTKEFDNTEKNWIHIAIMGGDVDGAKKLIEKMKRKELNAPDNDGLTPLNYAIMIESEELVKALLDKGVDVKQLNKGIGPLHSAVSVGNIKIMQLLIDKGVDPNALDRFSVNWEKFQTPLTQAVLSGCTDVVKELLKSGAKLNAGNGIGRSPLLVAVLGEDIEMVKCLLEAEADVNQVDIRGLYPLRAAALNGNVELLNILIQAKADIDKPGRDGLTALHLAALKGYGDVGDALLKAKADVNKKSDVGMTPLICAIKSRSLGLVTKLLAANADVNIGFEGATNHLREIVGVGNKQKLEELIKQREVNGTISVTVAEIASLTGHPQIASLLRPPREEKETVGDAVTRLIMEEMVKPLNHKYIQQKSDLILSKSSAWLNLIEAINHSKNISRKISDIFNEWERQKDKNGKTNFEVIKEVHSKAEQKPGFFNHEDQQKNYRFIEKLFNDFHDKTPTQKTEKVGLKK